MLNNRFFAYARQIKNITERVKLINRKWLCTPAM